MFPPTFECPLAVQSASPPLCQVFTVKWSVRLELLKKRTHARHSVSSQLVKYNIIGATIFMTFRTQIHTKKFCKNGFRNLQGTMSHRPLTNTSSLKITVQETVKLYTSVKVGHSGTSNLFYQRFSDYANTAKTTFTVTIYQAPTGPPSFLAVNLEAKSFTLVGITQIDIAIIKSKIKIKV